MRKIYLHKRFDSFLYPDADVLVEFFGDDSNEQNINLDN